MGTQETGWFQVNLLPYTAGGCGIVLRGGFALSIVTASVLTARCQWRLTVDKQKLNRTAS